MKTLVLITAMLVNLSVFAGEVTGAGAAVARVLKKSGITNATLSARGWRVIKPNSRVQLDDIKSIVAGGRVINYNNIGHIEFKSATNASTLGDVVHFDYVGGKIVKTQIQAVIVD